MEHILEVLRVSVDNEQRKAASAQLQLIQKDDPEQFLDYTWARISSSEVSHDIRFFLCTTVVEFVMDTWRNAVPKALKAKLFYQYADLVINECQPSLLLARKMALIPALMARREGSKANPLELPDLVSYLAFSYIDVLIDACGVEKEESGEIGKHMNIPLLSRMLLNLHMLMKTLSDDHVKGVFGTLCQKIIQPLSIVCSRLFLDSDPKSYDASLYFLKCSSYVFSYGVFEPSFYIYLLKTTWRLCDGLNSAESPDAYGRRLRLIEYAMKILENITTFYMDKISALPFTFFMSSIPADPDPDPDPDFPPPLFELVVILIETRGLGETPEEVLSEKIVCRAAGLLTKFVLFDDCDEFVQGCVRSFSESELLPRLLRRLVVDFLPDDTSIETRQGWEVGTEAERAAEDMDLSIKDIDSIAGAAASLFTALTGSAAGEAACLRVAWPLLNGLLQEGGEREATAALHAIGLGHYTMAFSEKFTCHSSYLTFLEKKLMPIIWNASSGDVAIMPSLFILRRVIWLVGMWCESVPHVEHRLQIHTALGKVLWAYQDNIVIVLTALRAVQNFVSSYNFSVGELTSTLLDTIFGAIQRLLPRLHSPYSVKEMAGIMHILVEKGAVQAHGDFILDIILPAVMQFISACGAEDEGASSRDMSTIMALLDCLQSSTKICTSDDAICRMYSLVILKCTTPGLPLTPWVEDNAWELLLVMGRSIGRAGTTSLRFFLKEALSWSLHNTQREFSSLYLTIRCVYTFLLMWDGAAEDFFPDDSIPLKWLETMWNTKSTKLRMACFCALAVIVRKSSCTRRRVVLLHALGLIAACEHIQATNAGVLAACLVYFCLPVPDLALRILPPGEPHTALSDLINTIQHQPALLEKLVLLLDISPSHLCVCLINVLLRKCVAMIPKMSSGDRQMVNIALENPQATMNADSVGYLKRIDDDDMEGNRSEIEVILEFMEDEAVRPCSPHLQRFRVFFSDLLT
ncbi:unnamed protein product [Phytomonas sp. Hart1]|nr:unnamed protein product [Phytomonas sp. Hart1]|eukprot:CCW70207.1 unnamed protein product [Phytomonas sp. isolate Hart1]